MDRPLLVVTFQGVIGDFSFPSTKLKGMSLEQKEQEMELS